MLSDHKQRVLDERIKVLENLRLKTNTMDLFHNEHQHYERHCTTKSCKRLKGIFHESMYR
jgi:hypothetical protein